MSNLEYTKLFRLDGKTAIVTGGTGVLGKHFCAGLAESGANVVVLDLDQERVDELAKKLNKQYKVKTLGVVCDVSSPSSIDTMLNQVVETLGEVHILHNNAATKSADLGAFFAPFEDYTLDQWRKIMSVNIDGLFLMAQAVGKQMVRQGSGGSIIQTASIYGSLGPDLRIYEGSHFLGQAINTPAVYSVSKAAVIGLTKYLATYWADKKIRVNTLSPGGTDSGQNDEFRKKYSARIPLGRMAKEEEIVGALLYLASDASSYVTGQNIIVDGGLHAW